MKHRICIEPNAVLLTGRKFLHRYSNYYVPYKAAICGVENVLFSFRAHTYARRISNLKTGLMYVFLSKDCSTKKIGESTTM